MLRSLRENGPVVLVPAAWTLATAGHVGLVSTRTVLIAHLVMDAVLVAFTVLSWREMRSGVLLAWKAVLVAGLAVTLVGTAGLAMDPVARPLARIAVVGWLFLPAIGLVYTGRKVPSADAWVYTVGGACSALGTLVYVATPLVSLDGIGLLAGLVVAALGQTAGIANAVYQY